MVSPTATDAALAATVEDLRAMGIVRAVTSARGGIEFFKYGQWRLLHARTTTGAWDFEAWLRGL